MAKYKDTILTAKGLEFATKAANGDFKFNITKVETSGTDLSDKSEADLKALTALPDVIGTGSIVGRDDGKKDNGVVGTQVQITNIGLEKSYTLNTFGLWAKADGEDTEYLYAIAVAEKDHGEYIPDFNDKVTLTFGVTIYVIVGDTDQVTVQFDPAGLATIEFVENAVAGIDLSKYVLKDDLETLLPKGIVSLSEDGKSVTAKTKNGEQTGIFVKQETLDKFADKTEVIKKNPDTGEVTEPVNFGTTNPINHAGDMYLGAHQSTDEDTAVAAAKAATVPGWYWFPEN